MPDDIAFTVPVRVRTSETDSWSLIKTIGEAIDAIYAVTDRDEASKPIFASALKKLYAASDSDQVMIVMNARDALQQALIVYGIGESPSKRR